MTCYIVDLDGTIADLSHRIHFIETNPKNFKAFFAAVKFDKPIAQTIDIVRSLHSDENKIIFCSGRSDVCREDTVQWLRNYVTYFYAGWSANISLYMRKDGDYRPDDIVKFEMLQKIRSDGFDPTVAFDDRLRVKKMWQDNGIFVLDVCQGDDNF